MSLLTEKRFFFLIALFVFVYIIIRAVFLPLYVDELYSFNHYVRTGFLSPFNDYRAANNHLLNTFLTTISYNLFGNSPFSIRLFNVLAFIPFSIYLYKIGGFIVHQIPRWTFYLVFLLSLNFISYFSLSRGYGISFALVLMTVFYVIQSFKCNSIKIILLSAIAMLLALYANFSLLLFVMISLGVLVVNIIKSRAYYFTKSNVVKLLLIGVGVIGSIAFSVKILFYYKELGELWWGGLEEGFWGVTILSLIEFLFQSKDSTFLYQGVLILLSLIMVVVYLLKEPFLAKFNRYNLFFIYLLLNIVGILAMAYFFDVNYPLQRTGLHLYLFFLGAYCFGIDKLKVKWIRVGLIFSLWFIPVHFLLNMNVTYVSCWEEDNIPNGFYEKAKELEKNSSSKYPLSIYIEGTTGSCWAYRVDNEKTDLPNSIVVRENTKQYYDYLIDRRENVAPFKYLYDSIDKQESSEVCLYKRKKQVDRNLIKEVVDTNFRTVNSEFYEFTRFEIDSIESSSLFFSVKSQFEYMQYPFQTSVVLSVENVEKKELIGYKTIRLDMKGIWNGEDVLKHGDFINDLPANEKLRIVVYVWNMKQVDYKIHRSEIKIYNVVE